MLNVREMKKTKVVPKMSPLNPRLRAIAWGVVILLGFIQAWADRHWMGPDGVSYLDVADKYLQRDWAWAINGYWSPLYSWIIAGAFSVMRPSVFREHTVVHLVNFVIYLIAFVCFEFLLVQVIRFQQKQES